ncbi:transposase [Actinoplanes couchii]
MRIRDALGPVFVDETFAQAFPAGGRPAASPGALALVSVLQYAEGLSDRRAADQVRARMDWKYLLGLELDDPGFRLHVARRFPGPADQARYRGEGPRRRSGPVLAARSAAGRGPAAHRFHACSRGGAGAEPDGVRRRDSAGGPGGPGRGRAGMADTVDRCRLDRTLRLPYRFVPVPERR